MEHIHDITGATNLYAVIANAAGERWNGTDFETFVVANWGDYDIPMTETPASSYSYSFDIPSDIDYSAILTVRVYEKQGASPAVSDILLDTGVVNWNGTAVIDLPVDGNSTSEFLTSHTIKTAANAIVPTCEVVITTTNTSDSDDVIKSGYTNDGGKIEFRLAAGTYYLWRNKRLYNFTDPVEFTVGSDGTVTYA